VSANNRKERIIGDLGDALQLTESAVRSIYQQAEDLFHQLLTLTNLDIILSTDENIVTILVCLLMEAISFGNFDP
jgi:hypothetical protein